MRPILDLHVLNKSIVTRKFRMFTVRALLQCVRLVHVLGLQGCYFDIPILKAHRRFLHFAFMGVAYEYQCLLFGYALAPRTISKCVGAPHS